MKKNKGFTLVELIAVVVIIGLILLIVFPATSRLMSDNEEKEYQTYYDLVEKAVELYSRNKKDDIGGTNGEGCVQDDSDMKISNLIKEEYVKKFTNDSNIECLSPGDFTAAELSAAGIDASQYADMVFENKNGVVTTEFSMICKKRNKPKIYFSKLIPKKSPCNRYVAEATNSLIKSITTGTTAISASVLSGNDYTVSGSATNNYVWYSGKMWRIVGYNSVDRTVKLVTDDLVSIVTYDTSSSDFRSSNIGTWLNNTFLNSLNNPNRYILDTSWNYTTMNNASTAPTATNLYTSKVGMLNLYEYDKIKGFLDKGANFWLLSKKDNGKAWYVSSSNTESTSNVNEFYGVRPSIVLRPSVAIVSGGQGTINNPYKLIGDSAANIGTPLNTRYPGEYVNINGSTFRIIERNSNYTRLVAVNALNVADIQFHYFHKVYSDDTYIGEYLVKTWATPINDKLVEGDFCRMLLTKDMAQTSQCPTQDILRMKVAIPKIGDMYTTTSNKAYWTLTNSEEEKLFVVNPQATLGSNGIEDYAAIRPVINLNSNVKIGSGNGTAANPYKIQ